MRYLITGEHGFLMSHLVPHLEGDIIYYRDDMDDYYLQDMDTIIHFASPSDEWDFKDKKRTSMTMIDMSMRLLDLAEQNNAKFIFASSMASKNPVNAYGSYKLAMEYYIQGTWESYCILRIPRVYSTLKKKGLMKKFRLNLVPEKDMNNVIEYLDINQWIEQTINFIARYGIFEYHDLRKDTLYNIKERYA